MEMFFSNNWYSERESSLKIASDEQVGEKWVRQSPILSIGNIMAPLLLTQTNLPLNHARCSTDPCQDGTERDLVTWTRNHV
jgi:hypothetical protein